MYHSITDSLPKKRERESGTVAYTKQLPVYMSYSLSEDSLKVLIEGYVEALKEVLDE